MGTLDSEYPLCDFLADLRDGRTYAADSRRYCFVLGSGASVSSGVMTGRSLVTNWIKDLYLRRHPGKGGEDAASWATSTNLGLADFDYTRRAEFYGEIYRLRFHSDLRRGQEYLRHVLAASRPSFGYSALAKILTSTEHRVVVTTNFDHLTEESLKLYTGIEPHVAGHESLAKFLGNGGKRPIIAKIHGDLFLQTYNAAEDIAQLRKEWRQPLETVFRNCIPIFLGYGGNDPGFMQFLTELPQDSFPHPPIWTYRVRSAPPTQQYIREFMVKHSGRYLAIPGFDEFMLLLADVFDIGKLDKIMEAEAAKRVQDYRESLDRVLKDLRDPSPLPGSPQFPALVKDVLSRLLGEAARRGWWEWHAAAQNAANPAAAEALYREGLDSLPDSPGLQACYAGFLAQRSPRDPQALERARAALADAEKTLGLEHLGTLMAVHQLGRVFHFRGEYATAEPLYRRALETRERVLGPDHPDTLGSLSNLALLLAAKGDRAAEPMFRRVLETYERVLGPEHPNTLHSLNNLAGLLAKKGEYPIAEPLYRRALEIRERILGPEHPDTLGSISNLAVLLAEKGDRAAAEPLHRRALDTRERALGPEHPDTLQSLNNLAVLLAENGDRAAAEPLYRRALETRERVLGPEHPDTLQSLNNLAVLLADNGDRVAAEPLCRRALGTRERVLGPEHPDTLQSLNNLASLLAAKGDRVAAEPLLLRVLETRERFLGPEHPNTLASLKNLASLLSAKGDRATAATFFRRALAGMERVLGPDHPQTKDCRADLAKLTDTQPG